MDRAARTLFALFLVLTWSFSPMAVGQAWAQSLAEAKEAEWVGERPDGYLGLIKPNTPDNIKKLVQDINAKRRERYLEIAKKNGTNLKAIQVIVGAKLIKRARPNEYIMNDAGEWIKK
jgi:uncharacterized protein YdbL (DUF1318 family)